MRGVANFNDQRLFCKERTRHYIWILLYSMFNKKEKEYLRLHSLAIVTGNWIPSEKNCDSSLPLASRHLARFRGSHKLSTVLTVRENFNESFINIEPVLSKMYRKNPPHITRHENPWDKINVYVGWCYHSLYNISIYGT